MTKIKRLILITLSLLLFACKPKTESLPKEIADQYMISFVQNPNGIAYYKDPTDLKSKLGVIPYKAMFGREEGHEYYKKNPYTIKVWNEGKEGFILYSKFSQDLIADVISFKSFRASNYGVVESNDLILYDSPFTDSKIVKKLNQFTIVEKVISSLDSADWIQIIDEGKYLYTKGKIQEYFSDELAKQAIQKKALNFRGYAKIKSESLEFLSEADLKKVKGNKDLLLSPVWNLYKSDYSELVGGKRFYKIRVSLGDKEGEYEIRRGNKIMTVKENPFPYEYLFVSEDNIEYIPEEKFTEYTIDHSNFKGDKKLLYAIARQYPSSNFNLMNLVLTKLGSTQNGESYHLVQFENTTLLFKRIDGNYEEDNYGTGFPVVPGSVQDIDGDGLSEFLVIWDGRGSVGYSLVGMKNGSYQSLADVDNISSKTNGIIEKVNYIENEEDEPFHRKGFRAYGSFRYDKGNFIPVKIKYKKSKARLRNKRQRDSDKEIETE